MITYLGCKYSERLTHAAEEFMVELFGNPVSYSVVPNYFVEAAMNIINGMAYFQPNICEKENEQQLNN